jgi:signal transduction histidine kinase
MVEDFPKVLQSMKHGADRIRDIVQGLRDFARLDETTYKAVNIHEGLESTLTMITERLGDITVIKNYSPLPEIECYAAELNQVLLNLITNAIDALSNRFDPTIRIQTSLTGNQEIRILIEDNGEGTTFEVLLPLGGRSIMLDREDLKSPLRTV